MIQGNALFKSGFIIEVPLSLDLKNSLAYGLADFGAACLRTLPAETAHHLGLAALRNGFADWLPEPKHPTILSGMRTSLPGIGELSHPIGLAAGFDKNAVAPHAWARLGFSFFELGAVTKRGQYGNPRPRLFRNKDDHSLINRMGFNNDGLTVIRERVAALKWNHDRVPFGFNIGKNKDTPVERAAEEYTQVLEALSPHGRFFVVNVSSPNTQGLRALAEPGFITELGQMVGGLTKRTWVKLDPDLPKVQFQSAVAAIVEQGFAGLVLTNTHRVVSPEVGGLSGHPLASMAATRLEWAWQIHRGRLPMIASGGIMSGVDIVERLIRGATAVQIYTALVYRGPWVVYKLLRELGDELRLRGYGSVGDAIGQYYDE